MSAYLVVDLTVHDPDGFAEYRAKVPAIIEAHGGRYLARGGATEVVEGDWQPNRFVLLEFPSVDAAKGFLAAPDYAEIIGIRHRCATSRVIVLAGID